MRNPKEYFIPPIPAAHWILEHRFRVPHTVCQCTGKKDRNGKLVFDRDVIQVHLNGEEKVTYFSIGWNGSGWSTYLGANRYGTFDGSVADNCEVRGTLFDREGKDLVFKQETERS